MRGWIGGLVAVVAVVVTLALVVIAVIAGDDETSIVDLEVGDCFDLPTGALDDGELRSVALVDCATPHLAEVVVVGALNTDGSAYPDDEELFALVESACRAADPVESDAFGLLPVAPTLELWESFEGRFFCVAIPFGGDPVTGSIAHS